METHTVDGVHWKESMYFKKFISSFSKLAHACMCYKICFKTFCMLLDYLAWNLLLEKTSIVFSAPPPMPYSTHPSYFEAIKKSTIYGDIYIELTYQVQYDWVFEWNGQNDPFWVNSLQHILKQIRANPKRVYLSALGAYWNEICMYYAGWLSTIKWLVTPQSLLRSTQIFAVLT